MSLRVEFYIRLTSRFNSMKFGRYSIGQFIVLFILIGFCLNFYKQPRNSTKIIQIDPTKNHFSITYQREKCACTRQLVREKFDHWTINENARSFCSPFSTLRGPHQRIIAISIFGAAENAVFSPERTLQFLYDLIADLELIYPTWILRVYHDDRTISRSTQCQIECEHFQVDFCSINELKLNFIPPKIWRFLPSIDIQYVDIMASRDLDSPLSKRERAAVDEWLASDYWFHTMRDHPEHGMAMLGGTWAFRVSSAPVLAETISKLILNPELIRKYVKTNDQEFLNTYIWPLTSSKETMRIMIHDSYLCQSSLVTKHPTRPFPTQRHAFNETNVFIGCFRPCSTSKQNIDKCPVACRPLQHQDWEQC